MAEKADTRTDAQLVAAVNAGDWAAFDAIYFRYRVWAFRLAWRFCGEAEEAQDAVQEAFVYLAGKFRQRHGLELRASLTTLLYPAIKHSALAIKRKRKRMGAGGNENAIDVPSPPPDSADPRGDLAAALTSLTDVHREILLMRFVDDLTLEEIASALAIPLGTAKSRLHHAIAAVRDNARLRKYFEQNP